MRGPETSDTSQEREKGDRKKTHLIMCINECLMPLLLDEYDGVFPLKGIAWALNPSPTLRLSLSTSLVTCCSVTEYG